MLGHTDRTFLSDFQPAGQERAAADYDISILLYNKKQAFINLLLTKSIKILIEIYKRTDLCYSTINPLWRKG
jgi:hypothetical protein